MAEKSELLSLDNNGGLLLKSDCELLKSNKAFQVLFDQTRGKGQSRKNKKRGQSRKNLQIKSARLLKFSPSGKNNLSRVTFEVFLLEVDKGKNTKTSDLKNANSSRISIVLMQRDKDKDLEKLKYKFDTINENIIDKNNDDIIKYAVNRMCSLDQASKRVKQVLDKLKLCSYQVDNAYTYTSPGHLAQPKASNDSEFILSQSED